MIKYNKDVICILKKSEEEMFESNSKLVDINHLILATLKLNNNVKKLLNKYNITYNSYKEKLNISKKSDSSKLIFYSINLKKILDLSYDTANRYSSNEIFIEHIFITIINENIDVQLLKDLDENLEDFYKDLVKSLTNKSTGLLLDIGTDLTNLAKSKKLSRAIGRKKEINEVIGILARKNKNNPILIGEAGVGKTAIVEELANMIVNNNVPDFLKNKKILSINIASIISGTKYRGEFEEKLTKILNECEANDDLIIFIDEIHTIVGAGGAEGAIDASNILKPILARGTLKIIGATTINEYKEFIEKDNALDRRFQKVYIDEPNNENLKNILMKLKGIYEGYHGVKINENIIDKIMELSKRYIYDRCEPDKSIDILDEVCAKVSLKEVKEEVQIRKYYDELENVKKEKNKSIINQNYDKAYSFREKEEDIESKINELEMIILEKKKRRKVTINDVIEVVNMKTKIPVYELNNDINKQIEVMKNNLRENIIGQNSAIDKLLEITKKIKLGIKDSNKSYSLLFCGPSGVGKTYLSRVYAKNLVGEKNIIKLDMSEYTDSASINKLIGSPAGYVGYNDNKNILEKIRVKPYSVLILDEIEKAHPSILNFFLNILDEGNCTDSNGRVIRFDNVVIIMTSNAEVSKNLVGFNNTNNEQLKEYFSKEFLNRIDEVVEFKSLTLDTINQIIIKEIKKYSEKYNKENIISIDMVNDIISESNYKDFGARKLCKIVRKKIENEIIYNMS